MLMIKKCGGKPISIAFHSVMTPNYPHSANIAITSGMEEI